MKLLFRSGGANVFKTFFGVIHVETKITRSLMFEGEAGDAHRSGVLFWSQTDHSLSFFVIIEA